MKPGDLVGPYLILEPLGAGGMGEVYRARDTRLEREVALKRLSDPELNQDDARRRVLNEARAAGALAHPNIAAIHDVLESPSGLVIVMEYVAGESLAARIGRGPVRAEEALDIASQIADALAEAHDRGIVHRDLKPANILMSPGGRPKILDFGIARSAPGHRERTVSPPDVPTEAGRIVGTPGYMAPEQLAGGRAEPRTDIYGLGILLFEMLTGHRPFHSRDYVGHALEVFEGPAPRVSDVAPHVPPVVAAIVDRALAKRPEDRFRDARELSAALANALHELSNARTMAASGLPRAGNWWRTRRVMLPALALFAAAAIAVALAMRWRLRSPSPAARPPVIAVLPFQNESASVSDTSLAVGLSDAIAKRLGVVRSIRVLPVEEARQAARDQRDPKKLVRILGAGFVVDGALRRAGDALTVRVTLVLDDGATRIVGPFEGRVDRLFELHRDVGDGLMSALAREGVEGAATPAAPAPPTTNQEAYADYAQARTFLERPDVPGNLDRAITLFQKAIGKDPRFAIAYAGLGEAYWAQYNETKDPAWTVQAQRANLDALRIDPAQPEVRMALAVMYEGLGRTKEATEELQQVLSDQPGNDSAHLLLSKIHASRSEWDAAVAEAQQAISLRPSYWRNHSDLGDILRRAGRFDAAAAAYARFAELQPDSARAFQRLGTALQEAGRLDEALASYQKVDTIRASWANYSNIGTLHYWRGNVPGAIAAYEKAIRLAPNQPDPYANLGDALRKSGQEEAADRNYRLAIEQVRKLLSVNEQDAIARAQLALYEAKRHDRTQAASDLRQALALAPQDADVLSMAASVHALTGEQEAACRALTSALQHGASRVTTRYTDEFAGLRGCAAYDEVLRAVK